jgi:hypothetical protein
MSIEQPSAVLPPLYARWIDSLLAAPVPPETRATCDDCAMCAPEDQPPQESALYFSPRIKCCTYQPRLPNYLVGRALEDRDFAFSAGRETLEKRIASRVGLTPLGLEQAARYRLLYANSSAAFGRTEALGCPHYLDVAGGRCGIWRHRNSVCATWFCKHERGAVGMAFWERLRDLLTAIESSLATWCVLESDLDPKALELVFRPPGKRESLTPEDLDDKPDPRSDAGLWGNWHGREREFYLECAHRVGLLEWGEVERIGGAQIAALARVTRNAFERLGSDDLPERLIPGKFELLSITGDAVRVATYRGADPLDLDPAILEMLPHFDGRPTPEVLRTIEEDLGLRVERDLILRLADFEILVPPRP